MLLFFHGHWAAIARDRRAAAAGETGSRRRDGSGTRRWGQQERGDTTETRHACKVFFHLGPVSRKLGGNQD